jgi:hypothetical protein
MSEDFDRLVRGADRTGAPTRSLFVLALLLCLVFFLAVGAYGFFEAEEEKNGNIPGAVAVLREFLTENESVAVFLGFEEGGENIPTGGAEDTAYEARVKEKARAYIAQKQGGRT